MPSAPNGSVRRRRSSRSPPLSGSWIVLVYPDHLELLDYKTDRRKTPADFVRAYRAQLELYAKAIEKRFAPRRVTYKGIYSLELGELIEV